jgi:anti-sigma B factor antagonist
MPDIQVGVSYDGPNQEVAVISARGFIDTTTAPELEKKLEEQLALSKYKIVVDLQNIDYVSSAGWGVFVSEIREIRENNGDLVLVNMSPDVYDVYELMEFSSILKSFDSLEEAVANFTGAPVRKEPSRSVSSRSGSSGRAEIPAGPQNSQQGRGGETRAPAGADRQADGGVQKRPPQDDHRNHAAQAADVFAQANSELGRRIIQVIVDNPYYEVKEIIKALKLPQYGGQKEKGGAVKKELKEMGLFDKSNRFELALRGRS